MKNISVKRLSLCILIVMITMLIPKETVRAATTADGILTYTVSNGSATITGLANTTYSGPLTIPSTITDGDKPYKVTSIGDKAFVNCKGLTGPLTIPYGVTSIGDSAFYQCTGLSGYLTIPDSVTSIDFRAFGWCGGLTGLTIGSSVVSISDQAFIFCGGITALTIPDNVTRIGNSAFYRCAGLRRLTIGNAVNSIGMDAFYDCVQLNTIISKPMIAPNTEYNVFYNVPSTAVLYTPNTPLNNTSYGNEPWSRFVRGNWEPTIKVVSGINRFDTAALISKQLCDYSFTVILTTGRNFPDALSAGPLAVQKNAPILLTEVNKIPIETLNEIKRIRSSKVIILGGLGAIDSSVEATLKNLGLSVERISGATRFLTAIETAKQVRASSGQLDRAILANGYGFADALSIGSYAGKAGIPILLTAANSLSPETKTAMVQFGIKKIDIIGGELAVSKAVESQLQAMGITVSRISGASRFATSSIIAGKYFAASENAIVSNGRGFVDALAAVPLAVLENAPILLVEKDSLPVVMSSYLNNSSQKFITITGGELAVNSTVRNQILDIIK